MGENVYNVQDDEIVFVPETGELIFGDSYYEIMDKNDTFNVTYTKTGFEAGDLRPENYYYCVDKTTGIVYGETDETTGEKYVLDQEIRYNINFNQDIVINVQGKDVLTSGLGRDLDIIIAAADAAVSAHDKQDAIQKKIDAATSDGDTAEVTRLNHMLSAAELETSYAEDNLTKAFSSGVTLYQSHLSDITTQISDLGSRMNRLELNKTRLESQKLTVEELKSTNEDTEIEETAVQFKEAQDVYDASLLVASQIVQKSLLDFI
jgi:flagellar hook-associated protein 3 FlgL